MARRNLLAFTTIGCISDKEASAITSGFKRRFFFKSKNGQPVNFALLELDLRSAQVKFTFQQTFQNHFLIREPVPT